MNGSQASAGIDAEVSPGPYRVLVVEDEPPVRELVADLLRDEGYVVEEARDGAEAIQAIDAYAEASEQACLVLLDMMLPRVDGIGVLRHLADRHLPIPVVAMSASRGALAAAENAGARMTMPKPFDIDELLDVVARNCRRGAA